jgi:hypothetical protein
VHTVGAAVQIWFVNSTYSCLSQIVQVFKTIHCGISSYVSKLGCKFKVYGTMNMNLS